MSADITETPEELRETAWNEDRAQDIRSFLASVKPLDGCCFCSNASYHAGRAAIEHLALALEDNCGSMPTLEQCADMLEYLTCIQPLSKTGCYGCSGDEKQTALNVVLRFVKDMICERTGRVSHG